MSNLVQRSPLAGEKIAVLGRYFVLYALAVILAGLAIALRPVVPLLSVLGGAFAVVLIAVTLTFLLSTPMVYEPAGFPQLSPMPGQFLAKDLLLLAAAI